MAHRIVDLSGPLITIWMAEIRLREGLSWVLISIVESMIDG
jgi:hypothetical protein